MPGRCRVNILADDRGAGARAAAARALHGVRIQHRSLTQCLPEAIQGLDARDAALVRSLATGAIRMLPRLLALSGRLLNRPPKRSDAILTDLLIIGLYQLEQTRIPAHAAVSATVSATGLLQRPKARGLINATLRRFQRERGSLLAEIDQDPEVRWLFPNWLLRRLQLAWPEHWQAIINASNQQPPMILRVNRRRCTTEDYANQLRDAGIAHREIPGLPAALRLDEPVSMDALPGFQRGLVSIQDSSAQWAAEFLAPKPGERVLDACAAPGGKSAALLERSDNAIALTAIDIDPDRLETLKTALERLGLSAEVRCMDLAKPPTEWPEAPFDRILLDAPCSATGVIRRHPDIKWLRRDQDITNLGRTQQQLLRNAWAMLKPGGRMLYTTCSILPEENHCQIQAFLAEHPDAEEIALEQPEGRVHRRNGLQRFPEPEGGDGFFYALIERRPERANQAP